MIPSHQVLEPPLQEERFLYPIYPLMALLSAFSIEMLVDLLMSLSPHALRITRRFKGVERNLVYASLALAALIGGSRIASNYNNFNGQLMYNFP